MTHQSHSTSPKEFKIIALRECQPGPAIGENPNQIARYWREHVAQCNWFNPAVECLVVMLLNSRCRIIGHHFVGMGLLNAVMIHAREIFRAAILAAAHSVVLVHNHPSGDPEPSDEDIRYTRRMVKSGRLLQIELLDHVIVGAPGKYCSLRELGHFP